MTTLSSSNRAQLAYAVESVWGTTPSTGSSKYLRMTGESLNFDLTKQSDKEIRSDRQMVSSTTVNAASTGDVKTHMQFAEYDPFLLGLLQTTDAASMYGVNGVSTAFTSTITTTTLTASVAPTGANAFTNLLPGQWFKFNLAADPNDGKYFRNSSTVAATSTVITFDTNTPGVAGGGAASTISSYRMANGVTVTSFSVERQVTDTTSPLYYTYRGQQPSKYAISLASGSLVEPTFSFTGKDLVAPTSTTNLPGTVAASQTYTIMNAVKGVGFVWEASVPLAGTFIKKLDISIDNQLRQQDAIGNLGAVGLGVGTLKISGTFEAYLADSSLFTKFLNDTYTALSFSIKDTSGNGYVFTLPKVMITKSNAPAASQNTDMMLSCSFDCFADITNSNAALRKTIFIDRLGAAVPISFA